VISEESRSGLQSANSRSRRSGAQAWKLVARSDHENKKQQSRWVGREEPIRNKEILLLDVWHQLKRGRCITWLCNECGWSVPTTKTWAWAT